MSEFLEAPDGSRIAYHQTPGTSPGVIFLGGFKSDMEGIKAISLEAWCREQGLGFIRFDYLDVG